ncbi:hypothetical protein V6N13_026218 [Hibiscus sabdariffa]
MDGSSRAETGFRSHPGTENGAPTSTMFFKFVFDAASSRTATSAASVLNIFLDATSSKTLTTAAASFPASTRFFKFPPRCCSFVSGSK